jgi:hypothetical protein
MRPNPLRAESFERSGRATSLPNKIKIRTCKLPKDFFREVRTSSDMLKSSRVSRRSTCDDDSLAPSTPSFRGVEQGPREQVRSTRKNETARLMSPVKLVDILPSHERTQNLRRRIKRELRERFVAFELPPIYSNRVSVEL